MESCHFTSGFLKEKWKKKVLISKAVRVDRRSRVSTSSAAEERWIGIEGMVPLRSKEFCCPSAEESDRKVSCLSLRITDFPGSHLRKSFPHILWKQIPCSHFTCLPPTMCPCNSRISFEPLAEHTGRTIEIPERIMALMVPWKEKRRTLPP